MLADFYKSQELFLIGDEVSHWENHPSIPSRYSSSYYRNHEANKARSRELAKAFYHKNKHNQEYKTKKREALKKWKREHPDKVKKASRHSVRKWQLENPEKYRANRRKHEKQPRTRMARNVRRRISQMISGKIGIRFNELVGCNRAFLMEWLQSKFKPGMAWNNYGTRWHIDHIVPVASFDLSDPEQRKKCSHYTNLQPLWATENMMKGDAMPRNHQPELLIPLTA